jgi:hypothetical protein
LSLTGRNSLRVLANWSTTPTTRKIGLADWPKGYHMPIMFNSILSDRGLELKNVILVRHKDQRVEKGRTPYELWRNDRKAFEDYACHQSFANRAKFKRAQKWATFVGTPSGATMFVGMYDAEYIGILDHDRSKPHMAGTDAAWSGDIYGLTLDREFDEFNGKLFVEWGDGARAWVQRADKQDKLVIELRAEFKEPDFPGFLSFRSLLSKLESLPPSWTQVLRAARGVYLLTCPKTKEQYVGKANGSGGFWQRWLDYARTGHGGNVALKSREPSDYQVSILEVAGTAAGEAEIGAMEDCWKLKLQSREMGLNRN